MLKLLSVKNFQSHEQTDLEFLPGINTIIGDPNSGKTALLRAVNWILRNRPLSDAYIRRGSSEECLAQIVLENQEKVVEVTRCRSGSSNWYHLVMDGVDTIFRSFGSTPPPDVLEALNLTDINYQSQLAPYFLVFDSPGSIATYIRSCTGLEDIKELSDLLGKRLRSSQSTLKDKKEVLDGLDADLQNINSVDIDTIENTIYLVEEKSKELFSLQVTLKRLENLRCEIVDCRESQIYLVYGDVEEVVENVECLKIKHQKLIDEIRSLEGVITELSSVKSQLVFTVSSNVVKNHIETFQYLQSQYNDLQCQIEKLETIIVGLSNSREEHVKFFSTKQLLHEQIRKLQEQLTLCPSCGSELTEQTRNILLKGTR
jgi:hypothetical protein